MAEREKGRTQLEPERYLFGVCTWPTGWSPWHLAAGNFSSKSSARLNSFPFRLPRMHVISRTNTVICRWRHAETGAIKIVNKMASKRLIRVLEHELSAIQHWLRDCISIFCVFLVYHRSSHQQFMQLILSCFTYRPFQRICCRPTHLHFIFAARPPLHQSQTCLLLRFVPRSQRNTTETTDTFNVSMQSHGSFPARRTPKRELCACSCSDDTAITADALNIINVDVRSNHGCFHFHFNLSARTSCALLHVRSKNKRKDKRILTTVKQFSIRRRWRNCVRFCRMVFGNYYAGVSVRFISVDFCAIYFIHTMPLFAFARALTSIKYTHTHACVYGGKAKYQNVAIFPNQ